MAQRITGINVRRTRAATKKQRAEEAKIEIEKLTFQISELRGIKEESLVATYGD